MNYTEMNPGELIYELGADGKKWADAFQQHFPSCGVDYDTLLGWFCNAVMAGHDHAHGNPPQNGDHAEWLLAREAKPDTFDEAAEQARLGFIPVQTAQPLMDRLELAEMILKDFERAPCITALLGEDPADNGGCGCIGCCSRAYFATIRQLTAEPADDLAERHRQWRREQE